MRSILIPVSTAMVVLWTASAQPAPKITTPKEFLGFNIGDDYSIASYTQLDKYWHKIALECDRCKLVDIGPTEEGRRQYMMIVSSPENIKNLEHYKDISARLAHAEGLTDEQARARAQEGKAVVWIDGGLHANETVGSQQEMEIVYQMASRTDPETTRFLNDVIGLYTLANPDGQELCATWYMREKDPLKRSLAALPRLYAKYTGHDDNRDFYMSNMKETTNMNRQMFLEWFPQIVYDHHQTGPAGAVIFMPPFRDPFNYNFDPLIPLDIEMVGSAMHSRLVAEGKGGSAMRTGANYSTWWNGGLRTITYFHNMIGILTEIIGEPTPMRIPLFADKQLPKGDWPMPVAPQEWHYRQSIEYEVTNNRAILDLASRYRETWLYNIYRMGRNSIEKGSRDNWTVTPKRIAALEAAGGRGALPEDLYDKILHDPKFRDPRGYILPSDQADFANATEFVNALLKNGITVMRAAQAFSVNGKDYPAGSYIVKTAQAFRPHVMDMFEPQDHPNDFAYPGGPPNRPYDITGWTLALQMGVQFDKIYDGFDGPFTKIAGLLPPPSARVIGSVAKPAGYLVSHKVNNSFVLINLLLAARCDVYWLNTAAVQDGRDLGTGTIWIPASANVLSVLEKAAREIGVSSYAVAEAPQGEAWKLKPIRIGLFDVYGGSIPSGWTRWLLEQYEFPFQVVYPMALDAGGLNNKFDTIVLTDGALRRETPNPESVPTEFRDRLGSITDAKTIPALKKFVESGGSLVTIGSATGIAAQLGIPVKNYVTETGKFYIPGALLRANLDNTHPLAYGMAPQVDVFFENSPVFRLEDTVHRVGWFSGPEVLSSGWAWGQQYLDGGTAIAEATVGFGKVVLLGPEVNFRDQPHGTYKLLFNALYYGSAQAASLH